MTLSKRPYSEQHLDRSLFTYVGILIVCPLTLQSCTQEHSSTHSTELHSETHHGSGYLNCGDGVSLCGVLVIESGFGTGAYKHHHPHVHGLWPETGHYGGSKCTSPSESSKDSHHVHSCYKQGGQSEHQLLNFQNHEWKKHGCCAGVASASDYFSQICTLSQEPLDIMAAARSSSGALESMTKDLKRAGYPVWRVERGTGQIFLTACAAAGTWHLSETSAFSATCGPSSKISSSAPLATKRQLRTHSPPVKGSQMCVAEQHGPKCAQDNDCAGVPGCLRCAHSGFCTNVALS